MEPLPRSNSVPNILGTSLSRVAGGTISIGRNSKMKKCLFASTGQGFTWQSVGILDFFPQGTVFRPGLAGTSTPANTTEHGVLVMK